MEQSGNQSTIINCLIKEVERLKEENEHLKAANSNARFIQLCMKEAAEKAAAEHGALKEDHEQLKAEHEQLKKVSEKVYAKFGEERLEMLATDKLINFDDENYEYFWTAENGDIVFWKIPNDLAIMPHPEEPDLNRVLSAFMDNLFGDEWGQLSSFGVRTMTKQDLIDADGFIDE